MSSVNIRRRETSFQVRYRLGGRAYPLVHAGSFKTLKEARARRDLVAAELAVGRNPAEALEASRHPLEPIKRETLREVAKRYEASRVHLSENGRRNDSSHLVRIVASLGDRDPQALGFGEIQEWIAQNTKTAENEGGLMPSSLDQEQPASLGARADLADGARRRNLPARRPKRRAPCLPPLLRRRGREDDDLSLQGSRDPTVHAAPTAAPARDPLAPRERAGEGARGACRPQRRDPDAEPLLARARPGELPQESLEALLDAALVWPR